MSIHGKDHPFPRFRAVAEPLRSDRRMAIVRLAWWSGVGTEGALDSRRSVRRELNCNHHCQSCPYRWCVMQFAVRPQPNVVR